MKEQKTYKKVMNWVTAELESGRLRIGDHLPGERSLAETLGVSRSSVREALRILEALGTISSSTGSGPQSGTIITASPQQALALSLSLQLATSQVEHHDVYAARQLLEGWAILHSEATEEVLNEAAALLDVMDNPALSVDEYLALDAQFHVTLSRSANNPLISTLMDALRTSVSEHTVTRARTLKNWPQTALRLQQEHRGILSALEKGNREEAAELIHIHIARYYRETDALP